MDYQVPQFIEHKPRIIGPLTFEQFGYVGGAGILIFAVYFLVPSFYIFLISSILIGALGLALAFVKVGPKTFPDFVLSLLRFSLGTKQYSWQKKASTLGPIQMERKPITAQEIAEEEKPKIKLSKGSPLRSLATKIQTKR